jgi:hypothetical protein
MTQYTYLIHANPREGRDDDFIAWYDSQHLADMLRIDGVVSAQLLKPSAANARTPAKYVAIFEFDTDDVEAIFNEMYKRGGTEDMPVSDALDSASVVTHLYERLGERRVS